MKNLFRLGMALLVIAIMFTGCDEPEDVNSGADFNSYSGGEAAIFVRNESSQRLIAFKGELRHDMLLGGIPNNPSQHGLKRNAVHFPAGQAVEFSMLLITEEDYIDHKSNLSAAPLFTRVYVLFNSQGTNDKHYTINSRLGGNQRINLIGNANYDIEWREDGIEGPTLGYAPRNMMSTNLFVEPGQYMLFPVFKYYNTVRATLSTIYPTAGTGNDRAYWFTTFLANNPAQIIQLDPTQALAILNNTKTLGAAWMIINNGSTSAVEVRMGNILQTDPMGYSYINAGSNDRAIQIDMSATGSTFAQTRQVSNINVGIGGQNTTVKTLNGGATTFILESDYQYDVNVDGDIFTPATFEAIIDLEGKVKVEGLF